MRRWYRTNFKFDDPIFRTEPDPRVWLVCPCTHRARSIKEAMEHRRERHAPGMFTRSMLLDETRRLLDIWLAEERIRVSYATYGTLSRFMGFPRAR